MRNKGFKELGHIFLGDI